MVRKKLYIPGGTLGVLGMMLELDAYWRDLTYEKNDCGCRGAVAVDVGAVAVDMVFFIFMSVHGIFALAAITPIKKDAENFFRSIPTAAAVVVASVAQPQAADPAEA